MTLPTTRAWTPPHKRAALHRDHALGAPSARSLLLTILGEFSLQQQKATWTSAFVKSLAVLGVDEKTSRQTLARTASRGILEPEKVGRRTRWHLTPKAVSLLKEGKERIYTFHTNKRSWNSKWVIIVVAIPEAKRDSRYNMKIMLGWAGFAPLSPGVWICPWVDRQDEAVKVLADLGLSEVSRIFIGELSVNDDTSKLVSDAWDLPSVEDAYESFQSCHENIKPTTDEEHFVALIRMINEWRRLPLKDPDLPPELLPPNWSGDKASELFHKLHEEWKPKSLAWWQDLRPME